MKTVNFAEIEWLDAVAYDRADEETEKKTPESLLHTVKSYGYVLNEDSKAIVLAYEDSGLDKSFIVIPKKWIKGMRIVGKTTINTSKNIAAHGVAQRRGR